MKNEIDHVLLHEKLLLNVNSPIEQRTWLMKLLGILRDDVNHKFNVVEEKLISVIQSKRINKVSNATDAFYITPELLLSVSSKVKSVAGYIPIQHAWEEGSLLDPNEFTDEHPFGISNPALIYQGDEKHLLAIIKYILPTWTHRNTSIPITIMLPINDHVDKELLLDRTGSWDCFNIDQEQTKQFLSSELGAVAFISSLQLLGLSDGYVISLLKQAGLVKTKDVEVDIDDSFTTLCERFEHIELEKYCLSLKVHEAVRDLMKNVDKVDTESNTPIISNVIYNKANKFNTISSVNFQEENGMQTTEHDLYNMRRSLSYLISHTSGVSITLNLPIIHPDMTKEKCSVPQLILPKDWADTLKAMRSSNNRPSLKKTKKEVAKNETEREKSIRKVTERLEAHKTLVQMILDQKYKTKSDFLPHSYPDPDQ
jgi:hypothetical protein